MKVRNVLYAATVVFFSTLAVAQTVQAPKNPNPTPSSSVVAKPASMHSLPHYTMPLPSPVRTIDPAVFARPPLDPKYAGKPTPKAVTITPSMESDPDLRPDDDSTPPAGE